MPDVPTNDGHESTRSGLAGWDTPMRFRAMLSKHGFICPRYVYNPPEDGSEDSFGDTATDDWTDDFYSEPSGGGNADPALIPSTLTVTNTTYVDATLTIRAGDRTGNDTGAWSYVADIRARRIYLSENDSSEDGAGTRKNDEPHLVVTRKCNAERGDRIKYDGDVYQLHGRTDYSAYTLWKLVPEEEE